MTSLGPLQIISETGSPSQLLIDRTPPVFTEEGSRCLGLLFQTSRNLLEKLPFYAQKETGGLRGYPSEQLSQHEIGQGKKYGREQIGHLYFDYVEHIEAHGHDEQAAYSGHLRYYRTGQEWLQKRRTHRDASLVEKHRNRRKEHPDAQRCGEDDRSQPIQHRLGEQGIVVTGQAAFQ